jgi:predicted nucleotide-binding protein (sugar kinase/HSP70/actin superfamily)
MCLTVSFIISILKLSDNRVCNLLYRNHNHETFLRASDLRALVNAVMNLRVPLGEGNFLTGRLPVSFSRRTGLRGVSNVQEYGILLPTG